MLTDQLPSETNTNGELKIFFDENSSCEYNKINIKNNAEVKDKFGKFNSVIVKEYETQSMLEIQNDKKKFNEIDEIQFNKDSDCDSQFVETLLEEIVSLAFNGQQLEPEVTNDNVGAQEDNYSIIKKLQDSSGYVSNTEIFNCVVCLKLNQPAEGCILRDCFHMFCTICLSKIIEQNNSAEIGCPYEDINFKCTNTLQEREIRGLVSTEIFEKYLEKCSKIACNGQAELNLNEILELEDASGFIANFDAFDCPICFMSFLPHEGCILRNCLHMFCKDCLAQTIKFSPDVEIKCPYANSDHICESTLQEGEVRSLVTEDVYEKHLAKSVQSAELQINNTYHCKTLNCPLFWIIEDSMDQIQCPACNFVNCLICGVIHNGLSCSDYQNQFLTNTELSENALNKLVNSRVAMRCPKCQVYIIKKEGCDGMTCIICRTEICWATRGPRWGPNGHGDRSGGCNCKLNGKRCHPECQNCH